VGEGWTLKIEKEVVAKSGAVRRVREAMSRVKLGFEGFEEFVINNYRVG
jgi:hypothetical protein